jgi:hypothetical protein
MSQGKSTRTPTRNPHYKTCERHKIIYVHECPWCKAKVARTG